MDRLKNSLKFLGTALVIVSLYFVVAKLVESRLWLSAWKPDKTFWILAVIGSFAYAQLNLFLSSAWYRLLRGFEGQSIPKHTITRLYGKCLIAKYIPGNIIQFAGRQVLGHAAGYSQKNLALSTFYEIIGLVGAALMLSFLGLLWLGLGEHFPLFQAYVPAPNDVAFIVAGILVFAGFGYVYHRSKDSPVYRPFMALPLVYYVLFMMGAGVVFSILNAGVYTIEFHLAIQLGVLFPLLWLIGFITPGAPAGIGIREAAINLLL